MKTSSALCGLISGLLVLATITHTANGAVVFDQFTIGSNGEASDPNFSANFGRFSADDFILTSAATVASARWYGWYSFGTPTLPDDFTIRLYEDASGVPGAVLATITLGGSPIRTDSGSDLIGYDIYEYVADFSGLNLAASTKYHISFINDTSTGNADWYWVDSAVAGTAHYSNSVPTGPWIATTANRGFQLSDTFAIPEPSLTLLSLAGLGAIGLRRRRN